MVPSPKVATYDLQPEMSAPELTDKAVEAIRSGNYDLIVLNFANPDMVGHTGILAAAIKAVETVDHGLGRLAEAIERAGGALLVTADHGNCELMRDPETGGPHTAHTTNPVPVVLLGGGEGVGLADGRLADLAPTLLALMQLPQPAEMTGASLLRERGYRKADPTHNLSRRDSLLAFRIEVDPANVHRPSGELVEPRHWQDTVRPSTGSGRGRVCGLRFHLGRNSSPLAAQRRYAGLRLGLRRVDAEHVHHGIEARRLAVAPQGGLDGAARKNTAIGGAMGELDQLAVGGKDHGVLANDAAAAQGSKADVAAPALAGVTIADPHAGIVQLDAAALGGRLAQHQGRSGRRVDLVAMMHLENLDVEVGIEGLRHLARQGRQQVDAQAHVARPDDGRVMRGGRES